VVSLTSRIALPALVALLTLTLTSPALADAPAASDEVALEVVAVSLPPAAAFDSTAALAPAPLMTDLETALLARVNADRAAMGIAPLASDPELLDLARARAAAQVGLPSLSHYDVAGKLAVQVLLNGGGFRYTLAGENLARLKPEDSDAVDQATNEAESALLNSPLHRKNILEPRFTKLAIGAVRGPDGKLVYAQIFRAA
jgi:uncharacterized protein YkwD